MARSDYEAVSREELLTVIERLETGRAEQAIRPAVVNRKVFGGNRTPAGAHALEVLASIFATCHQHGCDALDYLSVILRLPPDHDPVTVPLPLPRSFR